MLFFHLSPLAGEFYIRNYKKTDMSVFLETLSHILGISLKIPLILKSHGSYLKIYFFQWWTWQFLILSGKAKLKHWFSYETIHLIRQKRRLYLHIKSSPSPSLFRKYRSLSDTVCSMTRRDTRTYTERICQDFTTNPRKFWAWVNSSKGRRTPIPPITVNGT